MVDTGDIPRVPAPPPGGDDVTRLLGAEEDPARRNGARYRRRRTLPRAGLWAWPVSGRAVRFGHFFFFSGVRCPVSGFTNDRTRTSYLMYTSGPSTVPVLPANISGSITATGTTVYLVLRTLPTVPTYRTGWLVPSVPSAKRFHRQLERATDTTRPTLQREPLLYTMTHSQKPTRYLVRYDA